MTNEELLKELDDRYVKKTDYIKDIEEIKTLIQLISKELKIIRTILGMIGTGVVVGILEIMIKSLLG